MTTLTRMQNQNTFVWPLFDEDSLHGWFTPCRPVENVQLASHGMLSWYRNIERMKSKPKSDVCRTPDQDIRDGRINKYSSMDEMIAALEKAG